MATRTYRQPTTVIVKNYTSSATGIASFIFGLISIFWLAPLFVPLAVLMGIIAIISRQFAWGLIGLLCAFIGFLMSPILMGVLGVTSIVANLPSRESLPQSNVNLVQQQAHELEIRRENFVIESNNLLQQMDGMNPRLNDALSKLPAVETKYRDITAKVGT